MHENNSPWIHQLARTRPEVSISMNIDTNVLIVGGGIAGISTLYFLLTYTDKKICLLEANRVAHGATGHNAGYVTTNFEKPLREIISEYGEEKTFRDFKEIENTWSLLDELRGIAGNDLPFESVTGYGGYMRYQTFLEDLEDAYALRSLRSIPEKALIDQECNWYSLLPSHLQSLCKQVSQEEIAAKLETTETSYLGVLPGKAAITNSALLTDRVFTYCLEKYPDRVIAHEKSSVNTIELYEGYGIAMCGQYQVRATQIVLATNGFEQFAIINRTGEDIDPSFHHTIEAVVGYMSAYLLNEPAHSAANYYYSPLALSDQEYAIEPYFYMTRRNFKTDTHTKLISMGGPEVTLSDREMYFLDYNVDNAIYDKIDMFTSTQIGGEEYKRKFQWHGLMGYTKSGLRLIGPEPINPVLLYNIGCNGIGIMTSIYGGRKIAKIVQGEELPESIFDPKIK